jgi:hypothetical protein
MFYVDLSAEDEAGRRRQIGENVGAGKQSI